MALMGVSRRDLSFDIFRDRRCLGIGDIAHVPHPLIGNESHDEIDGTRQRQPRRAVPTVLPDYRPVRATSAETRDST
jgi:hypothetical protein